MPDFVQWIIQVVAYGVICYLLKREINLMDLRDKHQQERIEEVAKQAQDDKQQLENKLAEVAKQAQDDTKQLENKLDGLIADMPFKYTMRDDFIRTVAGFDAKLDKILDQLTRNNGGN